MDHQYENQSPYPNKIDENDNEELADFSDNNNNDSSDYFGGRWNSKFEPGDRTVDGSVIVDPSSRSIARKSQIGFVDEG